MIIPFTRFICCDNTGVRSLLCIGYIGQKKNILKIGNVICGVVKTASSDSIIKKTEIVRALIVRTKKPFKRQTNDFIHFLKNAVVILTNENQPRGTRIFGPILSELKSKFSKCVALANLII